MDYQGYFFFKAALLHFFFNPHNQRDFSNSWYSTRHFATNRFGGCWPSFNCLSSASTLDNLVKAPSPDGSRNALRLVLSAILLFLSAILLFLSAKVPTYCLLPKRAARKPMPKTPKPTTTTAPAES
ncbi:hypothetical protein ES705_18702 [subsurface metagenome]